MVTLGCSKNVYDSEVLMGQLKANNKNVVHEKEGNIVVVNTCGFIDNAKEESINTILDYSQKKENGDIDKLFVKEAFCGKQIIMKRFRARAKGRAAPIMKPYSNVTIILTEKLQEQK